MPPLVTADRALKHARLRAIFDSLAIDEILLTRPETLAWYFDGARTSVPTGGPAIFCAVVHRDGGALVIAPENEVDRLADEEIGQADFHPVPWFADPTSNAPGGALRDDALLRELRDARASLLPVERERYRDLGADIAAAMTAVLRCALPAMTETDLAGDLAAAVLGVGAVPSVILVAGASRGAVPHPLPTPSSIGRRAMAVVTAVRFGLHVSITRWVRFTRTGCASEAALREVEADIFAATTHGRPLGDVLSDIAAAYSRYGFGDADRPAWRAHHQGGPTGYLGRDPKAAPHQDVRVIAGGAFAWNPWVPHAKIEDTVIIDAGGVEVISHDPAWPTVTVRELDRPLTLDLS